MVSLFRAEWQKTAGNRWAVGMLMWIFPAAAFGMSVAAIVITLLSSGYREYLQGIGPIPWNTRMLETVGFLNSELGRLIILAFTAIMFAGEYQYGTWKNLIPRRRRVALILTKFVTLAVFVVISVIAFSIIAVIGTGLTSAIAGVEFGPALTGEVVGQFLSDYGLQLLVTLSATFIASGYAAVAAMVIRNILGSLLVGFIFSLGEATVLILTLVLYNVFKLPVQVVNIYLFTPGYNLANISAWAKNGVGYAYRVAMDYSLEPFSLAASLLIVALWILGLVALTLFLFRRQDITS
jgi:ABC-2 type transport system permease protein